MKKFQLRLNGFVPSPVLPSTTPVFKLIGVGFTEIAVLASKGAISKDIAKQQLLGAGHAATYTAGLVTDPSQKRELGETFQAAAKSIWGPRAHELDDIEGYHTVLAALNDDPRVDPAIAAKMIELGEPKQIGHAD